MSHVGFRGPHERCTSMMHDHMERMVRGHHEVTIVPLRGRVTPDLEHQGACLKNECR